MRNKLLKIATIPFLVSVLLSGCSEPANNKGITVQAGDNTQIETTQASADMAKASKSIVASAHDIATRVAKWQIAQFGNLTYIPESHREKSENPKFWIQATFYIGLTKWLEVDKNVEFMTYVNKMAKEQEYGLLTERPYHADDHTIGQTYLWLAEQTGNQEAIRPTQQHFNWILANRPDVGLEMLDITASGSGKQHLEGDCQLRWCWADALFMAPRTWLKLSNVTGDPKYFEYADAEFWAAADYLFSDDYGLFFRDSRYFEMKSDNGEPVFWGRGNGWVFASLPLIIDDLPNGHPSRERYLELYKKNAAALLKLQTPEGYWPASLLDPNKVKTPEVSGSAFITYGLAWGVNNGILTDDKSKEVVEKGWAALEKAVADDGRVNWVQHVGKSPDPVKKTDSQLYGSGAVLLAASEMAKWQG
ncbi:glycoside hydrolase family 88 protein [Rheinheimera sp. UJ51]|uniref:glycoside hydrolase family 88/105 protein n=1 Tax=unclassified Rheinheimera TaxID=115860 RepID=UPI001E3EC4F4|nr:MULTISPECIES: glycoside hydrolase family 88 protein [unclassified Rheinheimera]MCC5453271.1 glycoside hydrolase family 88 protein [Rheinheimera sp. UJ51]MCF4010955.1 glycoside hydrolase family 88 protein [Rheinheimera sp. UJ63]